MQLTTIKQSVPTRTKSCHKRHVHTFKCAVSHTYTRTHQLNQSLKVSEASISFCKSATIRRWVLFPLSLGVGFWPVGRGLFIVSVSAPVDSQPLIYGSRLIESSTGVVDLQEAHSAAGIRINCLLRPSSPQILNVSRFSSFLLLLFFNNDRIKMKTCEGTRGEWVPHQ